MADIFVRDANLVSLMNKTGYNITQENGQRKYGPPPGWIGPPPAKGSEIFIGKLPRDVFEDELVPLCKEFGQIYELRLMMEYNGENRGYAFVTFTNNEDASKAIKHLDDYEIRPGRHIGVCKSVDNCRLFVGGIPKDKSKEEIMAEISKYTEGVSKIILYSSVSDKSLNRGFAFVEYETHRAAAMARRKLNTNKIRLFDQEIAVDWAQPEAQVEEETMKRVTVLYVRNLSNKTTEDQLHIVFSMGGALRLERVKKLRDFAFIHYCKREDAQTALDRFDGMVLDGCVLEVTWAKPPETQKQKMLMEKSAGACLYRQINYDSLDHHAFDLNQTSQLPSFSLFPRSSSRQRIPMSNLNNISNSFTVTRPVQLLGYLCAENSWGSPLFQVQRIDSDPSDVFYICWVIIPSLPAQARRFMSDKVCRSPEEAKHYAACHVLKKFNIIDTEFPFISSPHSHPLPSKFSTSPKSYLTANNSTASKAGSNFGMYSPPKNNSFQPMKSPISTPHSFFCERGQGDAASFLSNSALDAFSNNDMENCPPLLDPETPIEPNSILGILSSLAAASNVDLPLFNKPKL